jgi:hypothetical protein
MLGERDRHALRTELAQWVQNTPDTETTSIFTENMKKSRLLKTIVQPACPSLKNLELHSGKSSLSSLKE